MIYLTDSGAGVLLTLQEAKNQIRTNTNDDDDFISALIEEATDYIQAETGIRFYEDTWIETFPCFDPMITLMKYPVTEIASVKYYDMGNNLTTLGTQFYLTQLPTFAQATLEPAPFTNIPPAYPRIDAWQVEYTTGLAVPPIAKRAAKILVETWYSNRGGESEPGSNGHEAAFGVTNLLRKLDKRGIV